MTGALITGHKHGEANLSVIEPPGDSKAVRARFKELAQNPGDLASIQLWDAHQGITKRKKFNLPNKAAATAQPSPESPGEGSEGGEQQQAETSAEASSAQTADDGPALSLEEAPDAGPKKAKR